MSRSIRPIGIDLFAGAGGLSLGFEQAGFDVAAAVEIDPVHCAVHKFNFPDTAVIAQSVATLSGADIRRAAGIGNRPVDCVFGGPPCQGFSMIGQRALDDPRNGLVMDFVRLVSELDARTFVFENVKGLTVGRHRQFLDELVEAFGRRGYEVRTPWKVLDAACFGVPQHRERLILFGAKRGTTVPKYPDPSTSPADSKRPVLGLPVGPTCSDAIGDLPNADRYDILLERDWLVTDAFREPSAYAAALRKNGMAFARPRPIDAHLLTSSARTVHSEISMRRFARTEPGTVEPISRFFKLSADGLCNTLRAGTDSARGAFTSPRPIHYLYDRCITVREMARLHGFPDWFRLHATKWHGARQIGNAVPPPLGRAVATTTLEALGHSPTLASACGLGDPALLNVEMSAAARLFGVDRPVQRRDRKSGAKKRKQADIEAAELELQIG